LPFSHSFQTILLRLFTFNHSRCYHNNCCSNNDGGLSATERIIGSLCGVKGHTYDVVYDLIFTSERVIGVLIKHPGDISPHRSSLNFQSIFIGNWNENRKDHLVQAELAVQRREKEEAALNGLKFDQIIKSHKFNFEIRYENVVSVQIKRGLIDTHLKFEMAHDGTGKAKRKLILQRKMIGEAKGIIESVMPSKIKK
jgi:hypothetical protein